MPHEHAEDVQEKQQNNSRKRNERGYLRWTAGEVLPVIPSSKCGSRKGFALGSRPLQPLAILFKVQLARLLDPLLAVDAVLEGEEV